MGVTSTLLKNTNVHGTNVHGDPSKDRTPDLSLWSPMEIVIPISTFSQTNMEMHAHV